MRDRLTIKDAFVLVTLSQRDFAGIYWKLWEPVITGGAMAFRNLLDWNDYRTGGAALPNPVVGQNRTPVAGRGTEPRSRPAPDAAQGVDAALTPSSGEWMKAA